MTELSSLPNIGKVLQAQLNSIGINTYEELLNIGSKKAWLQIQTIDESACYNRLLALEGAIQKVKKSLLSETTKKELKDFYLAYKL